MGGLSEKKKKKMMDIDCMCLEVGRIVGEVLDFPSIPTSLNLLFLFIKYFNLLESV